MTEFLIVALVVTLTPGPGTATILRVAARNGRRAAMSAVLGNSAGVLMWGALSALGVSSLILASEIAYDALRIVGAGVLIVLGLRSLLHRNRAVETVTAPVRAAGWRSGLITSTANPKLAVFFVALFPHSCGPTQRCCLMRWQWPASSSPSTSPGSPCWPSPSTGPDRF
jgi:threonine/homoserine/homoserine lactone efflux protein